MILSIFPRGTMLQIPPLAWRKAQDLLSSSDNLLVDVVIWAISRYCLTCALLNQFCSLLSASTSISLRLNPSGLPLPLEIFNKEGIFILVLFSQKIFYIQSPDIKKPIFMPIIFLSVIFDLLTYTNPSILMGAKQ